jgi:hypothetical protein
MIYIAETLILPEFARSVCCNVDGTPVVASTADSPITLELLLIYPMRYDRARAGNGPAGSYAASLDIVTGAVRTSGNAADGNGKPVIDTLPVAPLRADQLKLPVIKMILPILTYVPI